MSLNAGGLAQMTYQPHTAMDHGFGIPASGFTSRRGSQIKRLSMAPPPNISTISESHQQNVSPAPRTSRSHLLAGLRTAPKSPTVPASAPPTQAQAPFNFQQTQQNGLGNNYGRGIPQTALGGSFPQTQRYAMNANGQTYALPEILAPPTIQLEDDTEDGKIDPAAYAELMATKQYLAQQQMRLQQQLLNLTAAQQQMQMQSMGNGMVQQQSLHQAMPGQGIYNQQIQSGIQPIVTPVPGTPGVYSVYNPMTGQQGYFMDDGSQKQTASQVQEPLKELSESPPPMTPAFRAQVSPPPVEYVVQARSQSISPPKFSPPKSNSPPAAEVNPLPPPSANAFRRGHAKGLSSVTGSTANFSDGPKSGVPKTAGFPQTPMTGTFGPGQNRAGDHPIRQPRGPPSLEELIEKPTSKHEGSKNFATRQRRRAVNNLVRAGLDRRAASRGSNSIDSVGTPSSECEITFSISSDSDGDSVGSRSDSSGRPSPIGFERKQMKERSGERSSARMPFSIVSNGEGDIREKMAGVRLEEQDDSDGQHKAPLLVLTSAEKRKSSVF